MEFKDYYQTLGVTKTATADEIKKAYRKLARKYHPDVSKAADANEQMAALNEANAVLSDPEKRLAYDSLSESGPAARSHAGQEFRPPPNWDAGFEFSDSPSDNGQFSAFFEELFGRAARSQRYAGGQAGGDADAGSARASMRGNDHHARIELDLLDAYLGAQRIVSLRGARLDESGHVVPEERKLEIRIPKGVFEGQHIRLAGRGGAGIGGSPAGDLLLEVLFRPDPRWRAEGRDVHQRVPVSPWEAMLGGSIKVQAPGGETEVTLPQGWKAGRKLRLKGRGIPAATPGDLYLELELALPPALSDADRAAYASLAKSFANFNPRNAEGA